jgi:large subunit ribosomal protein L32e
MSERTPAGVRRRRAKRPRFVKLESWRYKRLKGGWRAPKGIDSKTRKAKKGWPPKPAVGYGTARKWRNVHPSGKREVVVENLREVENLKGLDVVGMISGRVGRKKRREITDKAKELGVMLLNPLKERALEAEATTRGG